MDVRRYVPLMLTVFRLLGAPLILPFLIFYGMPLNIMLVNVLIGTLFALLSLTDFFDGYFARRFGAVSEVGRILDPIADKVLVFSALVSLVAVHKLFFFWAIVFLGREFFVMGLRLLAAEQRLDIPVSYTAKLKTALQMIFITILIMNPCSGGIINISFRTPWNCAQSVMLLSSLILSVFSAYAYYRHFYMQRKKLHQNHETIIH